MEDPIASRAAGVIAAEMTPDTGLVAFVAVPGVGGSEIARVLAEKVPGAVVISAADLRREAGIEPGLLHHGQTFQTARERLRRALDEGQKVIWDVTTVHQRERRHLARASQRPGMTTLAVHLRVTLRVAQERGASQSPPLRPRLLQLLHDELIGVSAEVLIADGFTRAIELAV